MPGSAKTKAFLGPAKTKAFLGLAKTKAFLGLTPSTLTYAGAGPGGDVVGEAGDCSSVHSGSDAGEYSWSEASYAYSEDEVEEGTRATVPTRLRKLHEHAQSQVGTQKPSAGLGSAAMRSAAAPLIGIAATAVRAPSGAAPSGQQQLRDAACVVPAQRWDVERALTEQRPPRFGAFLEGGYQT